MVTVTDDWLGGIAERFAGTVGFEDDQVSVRVLKRLEEKLPDGVELKPAGGLVERLRRVKDEAELAAIGAASELADEVWRWSIERGLLGRPEREVAAAAEARIRELGAEPSFPAIVAAGPNGALPHAEPGAAGRSAPTSWSSSTWARSSTATAPTAPAPSPPASRARAVARSTRPCSRRRPPPSRCSPPGSEGEAVDTAAREVIEAAGHGERFGHGLGHGVGLEVHEGPRLSQRSEDTLAPNEVVTVEPGVYLPGELGVRIEDLVVVTDDGYRNLSGLPKNAGDRRLARERSPAALRDCACSIHRRRRAGPI